MYLLIKLLVLFWLYLAVGYAVAVVSQVIAHFVERMDGYYDLYMSIKLDPHTDDFGLNIIYYIIFWPCLMIGCVLMLVEVGLKKLLRMGKK